MSIYGPQKTTLGLNGCPAKPEGPKYLRLNLTLMFDLEFEEQVAGRAVPRFAGPPQFAQVGDQGITVQITVMGADCTPVDISLASSLSVTVSAPDGTLSTFTGAFVTTGADGKISATLGSATLAEAGFYFIQLSLKLGGETKHTTMGKFTVKANL